MKFHPHLAILTSLALPLLLTSCISPPKTDDGEGTGVEERAKETVVLEPDGTDLPPTTGALTAAQSRLATVAMAGHWKERDLVISDESDWTGSGVVISRTGDTLRILTNRHCLGLDDLATSELASQLDIEEFELAVAFMGGDKVVRPVARFAMHSAGPAPDMAILEVDARKLQAGVDYVIAPIQGREMVARGQRAIAIGAPSGLIGTETQGIISARRMIDGVGIIQTDAAVNPGNSGGPLFVELAAQRYLCGLNTFGLVDTVGLNFAYCADEHARQRWSWFAADPAGAVKALRERYGASARVAP